MTHHARLGLDEQPDAERLEAIRQPFGHRMRLAQLVKVVREREVGRRCERARLPDAAAKALAKPGEGE
jgi:hypothetical protein